MVTGELLLWVNTEAKPCRACGAVLPFYTKTQGDCLVGAMHQPVAFDDPNDAPTGAALVPLRDADVDPHAVWNLSEEMRDSRVHDQGETPG